MSDDKEFEAEFAPIFHGYLVEDHATTFAVSFSRLANDDPSPLGMVHFPSGSHYITYSEEHGLELKKVNDTAPNGHVPHRCDVEEHEHLSDSIHSEVIKKRDVESLMDIAANGTSLGRKWKLIFVQGIGELPLLQIELVLQSDVEFSKKFPGGAQQALDYVRTFVAGNQSLCYFLIVKP